MMVENKLGNKVTASKRVVTLRQVGRVEAKGKQKWLNLIQVSDWTLSRSKQKQSLVALPAMPTYIFNAS